MAATTSEPSRPAPTANSTAGPPRKRRRRTTPGGANDDCFACRKRAVKCDRKRPYCTQCIDAGKECSGYKTTLTWGVGVASRGKLRGLSCPVANKNIDGSDASPEEMESRRRKSSMTARIKKEESGEAVNIFQAPTSNPATHRSNTQSHPPHGMTLPMPIPQNHAHWHTPGFHDHLQSRHYDTAIPMQYPLLSGIGINTSGYQPPFTAGSVSSLGDAEYHSPMEYPHTPGSMCFPDIPTSIMSGSYSDHARTSSTVDSYSLNSNPMDYYADRMSSSVDSLVSAGSLSQTMHSDMNQPEADALDCMMFDNNGGMNFEEYDFAAAQYQDDEVEVEIERRDLLAPDTRFSNPFFHLTPRMQSLMDYYDQSICPYLVAFDSPENPYRKHILQLAMQNDGLQNAIAALATNNLRMRRKGPRQCGSVREITDAYGGISDDTNKPSPEESLYKQMSIDQLNMQLTDPRVAQDDSVLATLLILCLFHVCDSGFSKFKTQLAGMQKLLSLRKSEVRSGFTGWVQMFFAWFDVMTSTVNDREVQIKIESLDMLDYSADLGALEQFSGCDGQLFKLFARLGRLNLLAQGRPVRLQDGSRTPRMSTTHPSTTKSSSSSLRADRLFSTFEYGVADGNERDSSILNIEEETQSPSPINPHHPDERREFWYEWHDLRSRLQSWTMKWSPSSDGVAQSAGRDTGHRDMLHINESFRFSALLYTERLGYPLLPSSHHQYQSLVSQGLYHITSLDITSCVNKFLLWPLFIIGTECVDEGHRNIIRSRCVEVQKESGFYNNISTLDVLERVWMEVGSNVAGSEGAEVRARRLDSETARSGQYGQPFRWRRAMDRVDGEYLVI